MSILSSSEFGILRLTISRPTRRNSLTAEMFAELARQLRAADADPKIRVVLLRSAESVFSAGADLEEALKQEAALDAAAADFFKVIQHFKKPIVAQVNGPAVGEAFALLLWCDLVYANQHALFSLPAVALARTPRWGTAVVLSAAAGYPRAAEKLLLSEPISAEEARDMRLITAVIDDEHLDSVVAQRVSRLAVLPPAAVQATKALLRSSRDRLTAAETDLEAALYRERRDSPEAKEALSAFLEGRKPVFAPAA